MDIDKLREKQAEIKLNYYYWLRDEWGNSNNKDKISWLQDRMREIKQPRINEAEILREKFNKLGVKEKWLTLDCIYIVRQNTNFFLQRLEDSEYNYSHFPNI